MCRSVPAAVRDVTVSNNGRMDFLSVSWRAAEGDVDNYSVTLRDQERTVHTLTVSKSSTECVFKSLVSGRLYNISVTTRSEEFENHTMVQERTRKNVHKQFCPILGTVMEVFAVGFHIILFLCSRTFHSVEPYSHTHGS